MGIRTLIVSHLVVLGVGVYAGREMNADELSTYRGAYESTWSRLRRQAGVLSIGAVVVGGLLLVGRLVSRRRA
jgi:hypothetical protein